MLKRLLLVACLVPNCSLVACSGGLEDEAHKAVREQLKDPDSAKFKDEASDDVIQDQGVVCGEVNAKNSYGGYTGFQKYVYVRGEGATLGEDTDSSIAVMDRCTKALNEETRRLTAGLSNKT